MALAPMHPLAEPVLAGNILVGVDVSVGAQRALVYAAGVARIEHGRLTLLAVVPPPIWTRIAFPPPGYDPSLDRRRLGQGAARRGRLPAGRRVGHHPAGAGPADAIVCRAVEGCHDLVVLGCEGRGLLHGAIGGVSRKVVRRCPVPVLVVRELSWAATTQVAMRRR